MIFSNMIYYEMRMKRQEVYVVFDDSFLLVSDELEVSSIVCCYCFCMSQQNHLMISIYDVSWLTWLDLYVTILFRILLCYEYSEVKQMK